MGATQPERFLASRLRAALLQLFLNSTALNGSQPVDALTLSGTTLYGTTNAGGAYGQGDIFSINVDGSGFKDLLDFNGVNGANPNGRLTLSGVTLYGTTTSGGSPTTARSSRCISA